MIWAGRGYKGQRQFEVDSSYTPAMPKAMSHFSASRTYRALAEGDGDVGRVEITNVERHAEGVVALKRVMSWEDVRGRHEAADEGRV